MPFKDSLHIVSTDMIFGFLLPDWMLRLTERTRKFAEAYKNLQAYMQEMIDDRRNAEKKAERFDLFTNLLDANSEEEGANVKLFDSELIGMYLLLRGLGFFSNQGPQGIFLYFCLLDMRFAMHSSSFVVTY